MGELDKRYGSTGRVAARASGEPACRFLDADSTWALVFADDAAAVVTPGRFVRPTGRTSAF
jgi:hypothetical protein